MFKKLLSNLPYNPSLIDQVSFYAKRLKREAFVRRTGFVLVVLTVFVQMFAVISPPQPTLAHSNNDLISGGVRSAHEAGNDCRNNTGGYAEVLAYFDISCDNVEQTKDVKIDSHDSHDELYITGRLAYGKAGETPIDVSGKNYWMHKLSDHDAGTSKHEALEGTNKNGKKFYIVKDCGAGVTVVGLPPAPTPKCQWNQGLVTADPKCYEPCPVSTKYSLAKTDPQCYEACPVKGKTKLKSNDPACFEPCAYKGKETVAKNSANCFEPCQYNSVIASSNNACKPCKSSQTREDKTSCLKLSKTAKNDTQKLENADGSTARSGDIITYTLSVKNDGDTTIKDFVVQENISDSLDYSDVEQLNSGKLDKNNVIAWPITNIEGGKTITKQFSVKIKSVIPSTPISSTDPNHFDQKITNVYGNAITIKLPASAIKSVEITTTSLPNTGPGTSLAISFGLVVTVGYFFARTRLLARELVIVKADHNVSGAA